MKKKIGISAAVLAVCALLFAGYLAFLAPKAQSGQKSVKIEVVVESKNIDRTFEYRTNRSYVADLLEDEKGGLQTEMEDSQYGKFVSGLLGVKADSSKEYFNIKVNGTDAAVGVSRLPLEDGKVYTFTLMPL
ncbi:MULTISPECIES: DUF4430 domain-containing protein [Acutalibacteraceae]|uniref:DUF4430 domain-containing protein n=1 Tax=Acutalibacteraceae TaxID=3082771 RepID=UPI0013E8B894|nr:MULTISPECIES: DUF4430 domain-containing protein [Acutalibacteraceae]